MSTPFPNPWFSFIREDQHFRHHEAGPPGAKSQTWARDEPDPCPETRGRQSEPPQPRPTVSRRDPTTPPLTPPPFCGFPVFPHRPWPRQCAQNTPPLPLAGSPHESLQVFFRAPVCRNSRLKGSNCRKNPLLGACVYSVRLHYSLWLSPRFWYSFSFSAYSIFILF